MISHLFFHFIADSVPPSLNQTRPEAEGQGQDQEITSGNVTKSCDPVKTADASPVPFSKSSKFNISYPFPFCYNDHVRH